MPSWIWRKQHQLGNTLDPFELQLNWEDVRDKPLNEMLTALRSELKDYRDKRFNYFDNLRRDESPWANGARKFLALLGTAAVVLAAIASAASLYPQAKWLTDYSVAPLAAGGALFAYALIGAASFYEKATDTTSAYFRHLAITALIRDLWTKLEFALLKIVLDTAKDDDAASIEARRKVQSLAETFVTDLNKISSDEFTEWRTDFIASLAEIDEAAKLGRDAAEKTLKAAVAEAKAATDKAVAAALAAEQAAQPAIINLEIEGAFDGEVSVLVDDQEVARTHLAAYPVLGQKQGQRKLEVRGKKGDTPLADVQMLVLLPGIQPVKAKLRPPGGI